MSAQSGGLSRSELSEESFAELLSSARAGEREGLGALWRAYQPALLRYLSVLSPGDAEDLASETWMGAARTIAGFKGGQREFRAWLFTIARRRLSNLRRFRGRHHQISLAAEGFEAEGFSGTEEDVVERLSVGEAVALLRRLPRDQAEVIALRVIAGFSVDEVAGLMHKTPGAIRVASHRGLRRLADQLATRGDERDENPVTQGGATEIGGVL